MIRQIRFVGVGALLLITPTAWPLARQAPAATCKAIHASMTENRTTAGCKPGHADCFLGEVDGNHGLRGTTYFRGDTSTGPIKTSPEFFGYSGVFEYTTERGSLITRETGVASRTQRVVTAYQQITAATGEYTGATGYLFVSGENDGDRVVTRVTGEICYR